MWIVLILLYMVKTYQNKQHHIHINMFTTARSLYGVNIGTQDIKINKIIKPDYMHLGPCLGMYSHTDTSCANNHTFVASILEVMRVNAVPFDKSIGKTSDLPIVNAIYAYENPNKFRTIILQINHEIYTKEMKHAML